MFVFVWYQQCAQLDGGVNLLIEAGLLRNISLDATNLPTPRVRARVPYLNSFYSALDWLQLTTLSPTIELFQFNCLQI